MEAETRLASLGRVGGRLCLDFTNTVGWRGGENRYDHLTGYGDLVWWGVHAGAIDRSEAAGLLKRAKAEPEQAAREFARARELREALYGIFAAAARGERVSSADLEILNRALADSLARARVEPGAGGFVWGWAGAESLRRVVWPVARSAAELLTSAELARVGECAGAHCGWLYLDVSKNRSRRWCDMRDCGNRAKVRRHYARVRKELQQGDRS